MEKKELTSKILTQSTFKRQAEKTPQVKLYCITEKRHNQQFSGRN